ncbi:Transportin-3 [Rhynchospora pubera]|uniref:Transportin-3 n=1 Tax=Rhynchospora pubera TaxID=906938 RepID=A0AAV8FPS0_9POAL|nr:Transportin-3 [Rhynchospora pubera]
MSSALEKVVEAVRVLNHDTLSCNRVAANQWLLQFQHSHAAWEVATSLLTTSSLHLLPSDYNFEAHFFAAQILRRKIKSEGCYLNIGVKTDLLNALLLAAQRFSMGPSQLLTQICLALSALLLRMEDQKATIEQLFGSLQKLQVLDNGYIAVLELLTVLPEEVSEDLIGGTSADSQTRSCFKRELLSYTTTVLEFLIAQSERRLDDGLQFHERSRKIIRCLLSWVRADCFSEIQPASLAQHPLLNLVFNSLQISHSFDVAIEVMTELISRYEGLPEIFLCKVQYIKEFLLLPALISRDEKIIIGIASLLSEIGQAAPSLIAEGSNEALLLADALLSCFAFPSEDCEIADSTLPFWCSLAHYILGMEIKNGKRRVSFDVFCPVFSALLDAVLVRAQVDASETERLYIPDGLIYFRSNLEELLVDICQLLGPTSFVTKLFSGGWASSTQSISWKEVEARMFVLNMVSEALVQAGQPFDVSSVMHLVTILSNTKHDALNGLLALVYKTVGEVLGSYSKWFLSIAGPNLRHLLAFCASGIGQPICSKACSSALRKFCEEACSVIHEPQNLEILFWIIEDVERKYIAIEEEEEVVGAITLALSCIPNKDLKKTSLARLISSSYASIHRLIDADVDQSLRQDPAAYTVALNLAVRGFSRLGALFGHLTNPVLREVECEDDTVGTLVGILWPLLEKLFASSHMEHASLSAAACRSLSLAIHSSARYFLALLPQILDSLSTNFRMYQNHDCYLRTAAVAVKEFGHIEEYSSPCMSTFERFNSSASISALTSSYICDQEPDLIEAYASFASTFVTCCPKAVIAASGQLLEFSFQKAAISCTAMHTGAALAAMSYMSCLLDVGLTCMLESDASPCKESLSGVLVNLISRCGEGLISNILYALLGVSAMTRVHKSATILQQLATLCSICERTLWRSMLSWDSLSLWLRSSVQALPSEYLKPGEAEAIIPLWFKALENAALDFLKSAVAAGDNHVHMRGKGGRTLKRIIRDFAESHRTTLASNLNSF